MAPNPSGTSPCLDPVFGPITAAGYWTTTSYSLNLGYLWVVNFNNGSIYDVHKSGLNAGRASASADVTIQIKRPASGPPFVPPCQGGS